MYIQKERWRAGWKEASQEGREEDGEREETEGRSQLTYLHVSPSEMILGRFLI